MILKILGVFGSIFILILLIIGFFLMRFWKNIRKILKEAELSSGTPQTIHLNEINDREWLDAEPVKTLYLALKAEGYQEGKTYEIPELASVQLLSVANPENGTIGALFHHEIHGTWFEIQAFTKDRCIAFSDIKNMEFSSYPDWLDMNQMHGTDPRNIINVFEKRIAGEEIKRFTLDDFRDLYESNYRKVMKWKNEAGGITFEEVKMQNEQLETPISDDELYDAFLAVKVSEFNAWGFGMMEELKTNTAFEDTDDIVFIVPDQALCKAFVRYIESYMELTDRQLSELAEMAKDRMDCGVFFDEILSRLSVNLRPKEYCRIEFPLNARVFIENDIEINELEEVE